MSNDIQRIQSNERLSRVVVHNGIAYLSGVTANDTTTGVMAQTSDVLGKIDAYLELAGTDKSRLLSVQIWLRDIDRDFGRDADLVVMVDCQIPSDDLIVHFF